MLLKTEFLPDDGTFNVLNQATIYQEEEFACQGYDGRNDPGPPTKD
jgi:hypothetical protein